MKQFPSIKVAIEWIRKINEYLQVDTSIYPGCLKILHNLIRILYNVIVQFSYTILNSQKLESKLRDSGYRSVSEVARKIGVHRNTINHFLSGHSVFPESINKLFELLQVDPREMLLVKETGYDLKTISGLIDNMIELNKTCCFVLFGSRARKTNKKFSDFDIGVFSKDILSHSNYLRLVESAETAAEDLPVMVDVVNLNRADESFLSNLSKDIVFLGGRLSDWLALKEKING